MENITVQFIKADNNKVININAITWIKKMDECLEVCAKSTGCNEGSDTHKICNNQSQNGYSKLNKLFN